MRGMMNSFKVLSNKVSGHEAGAVVRESDLEGVNVAALVEAGHLAPVANVRESKQEKNEQE